MRDFRPLARGSCSICAIPAPNIAPRTARYVRERHMPTQEPLGAVRAVGSVLADELPPPVLRCRLGLPNGAGLDGKRLWALPPKPIAPDPVAFNRHATSVGVGCSCHRSTPHRLALYGRGPAPEPDDQIVGHRRPEALLAHHTVRTKRPHGFVVAPGATDVVGPYALQAARWCGCDPTLLSPQGWVAPSRLGAQSVQNCCSASTHARGPFCVSMSRTKRMANPCSSKTKMSCRNESQNEKADRPLSGSTPSGCQQPRYGNASTLPSVAE